METNIVIGSILAALQKNDQPAFEGLLSPEIKFTHNGEAGNIHQWAGEFFFSDKPAEFVAVDKIEGGIVLAQLRVDGLGVLPVKLHFTITEGKVSALDAGRQ